nr:helix-turn-helix domain-containing protein [Mesorhizobium soli]
MRTPFSRWVDDLHYTCGSFRPSAMDTNLDIRGEARRINACGMEFSHISNDLDRVEHDWDDVRRDAIEQLFLIVQLEGSCGVEHSGRQSALNVGDCILVDSTQPTTFHFGGKFSNHLSLNLPRQPMYFHGGDKLDVARTLDAVDPMAVTLRALVAKVLATPESDLHAASLRQLMLDATRQAFVSNVESVLSFDSLGDLASGRLQLVDILIDQHLTGPYLSAQWLAKRVGVSIRILQLHFQGLGTTCTNFIRDKRLRFAHEKIKQLRFQRGTQTIADVAYSAGFNDLSYFNRCFKELFACAPSDLLKSTPNRRTH